MTDDDVRAPTNWAYEDYVSYVVDQDDEGEPVAYDVTEENGRLIAEAVNVYTALRAAYKTRDAAAWNAAVEKVKFD